MKKIYCLANEYDPDQVRNKGGAFSGATEDAVSAAYDASADAHKAGTADAHNRAAKLHRTAVKRFTENDQNDVYAALHESIAKGHDQLAARSVPIANDMLFAEREGDGWNVALENDAAIDDEGWCLIAPFGEWPKTRLYRENGQVKEQKFIQVLDNEAADAMMAKENSFFRTLKRAIVGIPIFKGHGDLNDADPQAVSNDTRKIKLGIIDKIRKGTRGIEAHFALDNDGENAVNREGYKFPSAFWYVLPNGMRGDAILAKPFKLISVALTPWPNISGVESLANARHAASGPNRASQHETKPQDHMKQLLIGWLAAQGVALANDATDQSVLEAFQKHVTTQAASIAALGNEKSNLGGQISALTNDRDQQKKRADDAATALANEQTSRKTERKGRAEAIADLVIHRGIKTIAERDATIAALENSADFDKDVKALLALQPTRTTTTNNRDVSGKQTAALENEQAGALREYQDAFAKELPLANQDAVKAHNQVMAKYPTLAEKLRPKKAA